jgi:GNAT superfamily N-acetyltransferase
MYRGLRLNNLPPELLEHVKRHTRMPYDESEVGQHFKIGPVLLDHIENSHHDPELSLGQNWTINRDFAGKAGCSQTGPCQLGVVLEADIPTDEHSFDPKNRGQNPGTMQSEQQVTILPDVPLNITGLKLVGYGNGGPGGHDLEVLNDPRYVTRQKEFPSVAQFHSGPQIRIAYLRNKTAARGVPGYNLDDCEPSGRYLTADTIPNQPAPAGWERGTVSFVNPLRLEHLHGGWRQALSAHYDGRTGKELTASLVADGYDGIITADHHGYGEIVAFSPPTYKKLDLKIRYPETIRDPQKDTSDYNFTGSPETQYHHRALDDDDLEDIDTRKDSADDWYAEMATRRAQGLPEIDWNTWINKRISYRLAMAWDEWAPKVKGGCLLDGCYWDKNGGNDSRYTIPQAGAFLHYSHGQRWGKPALNVIGIYTHPDNRNDGVAEALMRRLAEDHPGVHIDTGYMTPDGQRFHDRVLEKEPSARELVTAVRLAMAWDEWKDKIQHHEYGDDFLQGTDNTGTYKIDHGPDPDEPDFTHESWLNYGWGRDDNGEPVLDIHDLGTAAPFRNRGVAEALMRRLHQDNPGIRINPGGMTDMGQAFHDRMLEKEPDARALVTAASLLVGPYDAYDENDWFQRHMDHPPLENPDTADWYHVSPHRMQVGTILAPMRGETPWDDEPYDNGLQNRANWVWIEYDERKAREWQQWVLKHQPQCHLYRVQPHLGPFAWNGTADEGWVTDWAEILEEMT